MVGPQPSEQRERYRQGVTVTIRTTDGRNFTDTVYLPKGSGALGIAWSDIEAKYRALMPNSGLAGERIEASLGVIRNLVGGASIAPLIELLRP